MTLQDQSEASQIVYGVWEDDKDYFAKHLVGLYATREAAEEKAANPAVYNRGSRFEETADWFVDEHKVHASLREQS